MNQPLMPRYRATPGKPLQLRDFDPGETGPYCDKTEARADLKALKKKIAELARMLNAEGRRAMLIVLQGMDASGKDGAVRHVFTGVNPQICRVTAFAEPDAEERKHDYLWRIHRAMPAMGQLGVFNRSHYEDVLVTRAHGKLSEAETLVRLRQIADMERTWTENGITLLKFFLHISQAEQERRFQARLDDPRKRWKAKKSDFKDRKLWGRFQEAYEEAISHTTRRDAPWYVVPADHKWYRDVVIAQVLLKTMQEMKLKYPKETAIKN